MNIKNFNHPKILLETLIVKLCYLDKTIEINKYLYENKNFSSENEASIEDQKYSLKNDTNVNIDNNVVKSIDEDSLKNDKKEKKVISEIQKDNTLDNKISIKDIEANWTEILDMIQEKNSKTALF